MNEVSSTWLHYKLIIDQVLTLQVLCTCITQNIV